MSAALLKLPGPRTAPKPRDAGLPAPPPAPPPAPTAPALALPAPRPLAEILAEMQAVAPARLVSAQALGRRQHLPLGDALLSRGWIDEATLLRATARQWGVRIVDPVAEAPDPRLIDLFGIERCLAHSAVPLRRVGRTTIVATARPEGFADFAAGAPPGAGALVMALASEAVIQAALLARRRTWLVRRAEARVAGRESCRTLGLRRMVLGAAAGLLALVALAVWSPLAAFGTLFGWATVSLLFSCLLRFTALVDSLRHAHRPAAAPQPAPPGPLPIVSILVPLFREDDIAPRLIRRLGRLNYPKERLDILLVVEETDSQTREALHQSRLPRWMRVVTVPDGPIRTKPRALNYALDFCRGSIIGVYDAEDAPEADQIHRVVRHFAQAPANVACLQGVLDFYNAGHNWLTRCFTIEYAAWFRVILPGIARLGLVVPLGGTTLFFRRDVLEELGGWDAHNVTEDADLGLRLARHGYRTEVIPTVTEEEPNGRALPWVRQRSRWLKGYLMTWAVHMRNPARLWRELGPARFLGIHIVLFCTSSQFVLAPVLWSFWVTTLGFGHPFGNVLPPVLVHAIYATFLLSEGVNLVAGLWACRGPKHRHLLAWVPTLPLYFPLATLAAYKALWEMVRQPFYWDKTSHGLMEGIEADEALATDAAEATAAPLPVLVHDASPPGRGIAAAAQAEPPSRGPDTTADRGDILGLAWPDFARQHLRQRPAALLRVPSPPPGITLVQMMPPLLAPPPQSAEPPQEVQAPDGAPPGPRRTEWPGRRIAWPAIARRLLTAAARPGNEGRGSGLSFPPQRAGIELQPCFEGF